MSKMLKVDYVHCDYVLLHKTRLRISTHQVPVVAIW